WHHGFPVSPDSIADMMNRRQLAFWILTLESAVGKQFNLPLFITGDVIAIISYLYQATTAGVFNYPTDSITLELPNRDNAEEIIEQLRAETRFSFGPTPKKITIFGTEIKVGTERVFIDEGSLANYEEAIKNVNKTDQAVVFLNIIPHDKLALYAI